MHKEAGKRGRKGVGIRGEETNQIFRRDGSPSRLCVFLEKGRRGYSRAGDCSNNIPPQTHSPPSFPSVRRSIFSPAMLYWMQAAADG